MPPLLLNKPPMTGCYGPNPWISLYGTLEIADTEIAPPPPPHRFFFFYCYLHFAAGWMLFFSLFALLFLPPFHVISLVEIGHKYTSNFSLKFFVCDAFILFILAVRGRGSAVITIVLCGGMFCDQNHEHDDDQDDESDDASHGQGVLLMLLCFFQLLDALFGVFDGAFH